MESRYGKAQPNPFQRSSASTGLRAAAEPSNTVHTSLYLPRAVHDALREVAFDERRKIHDIVMEGIETALRSRGRQIGKKR